MKCIITAEKKSQLEQLLEAMQAVTTNDPKAFDRALTLFVEVTGFTKTCFPIPTQSAWGRLKELIRSLVVTGQHWAQVVLDIVNLEIDWQPKQPVLVPVPAHVGQPGPRRRS